MLCAKQVTEWDRVAALIEECRREREACASVRDAIRKAKPQTDRFSISIAGRVRARVPERAEVGRRSD